MRNEGNNSNSGGHKLKFSTLVNEKVQHSPKNDNSQHRGEYIRFTLKSQKNSITKQDTPEKFVYIIDPKAFQGFSRHFEKGNTTVYNQKGQKLHYNQNSKKFEVEK